MKQSYGIFVSLLIIGIQASAQEPISVHDLAQAWLSAKYDKCSSELVDVMDLGLIGSSRKQVLDLSEGDCAKIENPISAKCLQSLNTILEPKFSDKIKSWDCQARTAAAVVAADPVASSPSGPEIICSSDNKVIVDSAHSSCSLAVSCPKDFSFVRKEPFKAGNYGITCNTDERGGCWDLNLNTVGDSRYCHNPRIKELGVIFNGAEQTLNSGAR